MAQNSKMRVFKLLLAVFALWFVFQIIFASNGSEYKIQAPKTTAIMELRKEELGQNGGSAIRYNFVPLEKISPSLRLAVLVAEDFEFLDHKGFSLSEIYYSVLDSLRKFRIPRGASTITQQLAKNLYLSPSKNPLRKIKEAIITLKLENTLGKRRIFEIYLNIIELGPGVFGVEAASQYWFSKSASALSQSESAKLAAIIPGPNTKFNPKKFPSRVSARQELLLRRIQRVRLPAGL